MPRVSLLLAGAILYFSSSSAQSLPDCALYNQPKNNDTINSSTNARLTWYAAANASSYAVYFWTGSVVSTEPVVTIDSVNYDIAGLVPGTVYNWFVVPKNSYGAATGCTQHMSFSTAAATTQPSTANGLLGSYYKGIDFMGLPLLVRLDTTIDFELTYRRYPAALSPAPGIVPDNLYSVRWTGQVQATHSETYTFYTLSDDGIRLWVNGVKLVDNWATQDATEHSGSIALIAGHKYNIVIEYYENTGDAVAKLYWSGFSTPKTIVPKQQLFPPITGRTAEQERAAAMPAVNAGISPNPVQQGQPLRMQITIDKPVTADLNIIGSSGNFISKQQFRLEKGLNIKTINTSMLPPGPYILILYAGSKPFIMKWMIQ